MTTTNADATANLSIDETELNKVSDVSVASTEPIPLTITGTDTTGDTTTKTINFIIYDVVDPTYTEAMSAQDFSIPLAMVNKDNFILYSDVRAYDLTRLESMRELPSSSIKIISPLPTTSGDYDMTFASASGKTTITVQVNVVETNVIVEAEDIILSVEEAQRISEADLLKRTKASVRTENYYARTRLSIANSEVDKFFMLQYGSNDPIPLTITGSDTKGDMMTKVVNVYVYDVVNRSDNEALVAHPFGIAVRDASPKNIIHYADAKAYDISTGLPKELEGVIVNFKAGEIPILPTKEGRYTLEFSTPSGKTTLDVITMLYDDINLEHAEAMTASDFAIALSDVSEKNFLNFWYTRPSVYDFTHYPVWNPEYIDDNIKLTSPLPTTTGIHDVTFVSGSGKTSVTVQVYVYDVVKWNQEAINAHDFTINLNDVNERNFIAYAGAKSYDLKPLYDNFMKISPTELKEITVISPLPTTTGVHNVTFATPSGMTMFTVQATVQDSGVSLNVDQENIVLSLQEAQTISETGLLKRINARVTTTNPKMTTKLSIDSAEMNKLSQLTQSPTGLIDVDVIGTVSLNNESLETIRKKIFVHVYDVVNAVDQAAMNAHDFELPLALVSEENFIDRSGVAVYDIATEKLGDARAPMRLQDDVKVISALPTKTGIHNVTFASASGKTTITVQVNVIESKITMHADDVVLSLAEANTASEDYLLKRMNARAMTETINARTSLAIAETEIAKLSMLTSGHKDPIPITIVSRDTSGDATTKVVNVYVPAVVNRNDNEALTAHTFAIAVSEISVENIIRYADAQAYDISISSPKPLTNIVVSVEEDSTISSKLPKKPGAYFITFSTPSGKTTTTVKAYVYAGIDSARTEAIAAADFAIELGNVNTENVLVHSRATAYDISGFLSGTYPDPNFLSDRVKVRSALPTTTGVHNVSLVSESGKTTATVKAYVYNTLNQDEAINARDFTIALNDVNENNFIAYAEAKGYDVTSLYDYYEAIPPTELAGMSVISSLPTTSGVHDVTLATPSGMTTMTVQATVLEPAVTVYADDIVLSLQEAQATSVVDLLARMHARATTTTPNTTTSVFIAPTEVSKLLQLTAAPTGLIGIDVVGMNSAWNVVQKKVFVHVYDSVNTVDQEAMNAHNFEMPLASVNEANFIAASGLSVYDISPVKRPNERYPIRLSEGANVISVLPTTSGVHDVIFASPSGKTMITVQVTVLESAITVHADDIILSFYEARKTSEADLLERMHAQATTMHVGAKTSMAISETEVAKISQLHEGSKDKEAIQLTIIGRDTTGDITTKVVNVYVLHSHFYFDLAGKVAVFVQDYDVRIALNNLSVENIIRYGGVRVYDISGDSPRDLDINILFLTDYTYDGYTLALPEVSGEHAVVFTVDNIGSIGELFISVYDDIDSVRKEGIRASDFVIALNAVTEENVREYSQPLVDIWDDENEIVDSYEENIKLASILPTTTGVHDVIFLSESGKTSTTVKAYVYDVVNLSYDYGYGEGMNAHDFTIGLNDVSVENFIAYAEAKGYGISRIERYYPSYNDTIYRPIPPIELPGVVVTSPLPTTAGVHDVTFSTLSGRTKITVQVTVMKSTFTIHARDFAIALDDVSNENFIAYAEAKGYDITTLPGTEVGVSLVSELPITTGAHDVTFATALGKAMLTVKAYVYDAVNVPSREAINGHDFVIALRDVSSENFIAYAEARGYYIRSLPGLAIQMNVTSVLPTTVGTHDVTFTTASGNSSMTVKVYVYDVVNPTNSTHPSEGDAMEAMNAHDFTIPLSFVSNENFIYYAEARGYDIIRLPGVEIRVSVTSVLPTTVGEYDVTFETKRGTSLTVKATVIATNVTVNANDIVLSLAEAQATSEADLLVRTNAIATTTNTGAVARLDIPQTEVNKVTHLGLVPQEPIQITITGLDSSGDSSTKTVNVYVYYEVNTTNQEAMISHDFAIALRDVSSENFIAYAEAKGYDITTLSPREVHVSVTSVLPTTVGIHDVTFETASGNTNMIVKVYVFDSVNPVDPTHPSEDDAMEAINAHDFIIPLALVNAANFLSYAEAKGYDITQLPGIEVPGVQLASVLPTTAGTHEVMFKTKSGETEITVQATVLETNITLTANDVYLTLLEARQTSEADLLARSGAQAVSGNPNVSTSVVISEDEVAKIIVLGVPLVNPAENPIPITITSSDTAGDVTQITINVYVFREIDKTQNVGMNGHDFAIALSEVSEANIMRYSDVGIYDLSSTSVTRLGTPSLISELPTKTGDYILSFRGVSERAFVVLAYVYDVVNPVYPTHPSEGDAMEGMRANDFAIALQDVSIENFIYDAEVSADDISTMPPLALLGNISIRQPLPTRPGTYDVTFVTPSGRTEHTVKAYVYDVVNKPDSEAMNAHDFTIPLALVNNENFITYAEAQGYNISELPANDMAVSMTSPLPTAVGEYAVTFSTASGNTEITVKATVIATNVSVRADDLVLSLAEAQATTEADLLTRTNASATTTNAGAIATLEIRQTEVDKVAKLERVPAGAIALTITGRDVVGDSSTKTVNVYVYNEVNTTDQEAINAHDFAIALRDVTSENFIYYAEARGYDIRTLPATLVEVKVRSALPTTIGEHDVTFATEKGTALTIKAYVYDKVNPTNPTHPTEDDAMEAMNAQDFAIMLRDVSEENFIAYAKARGYDISSLPGTEVQVSVVSVLPTTGGLHDVTFATASGRTMITVQVFVVDLRSNAQMETHGLSVEKTEHESELDKSTQANNDVQTKPADDTGNSSSDDLSVAVKDEDDATRSALQGAENTDTGTI